MKENLNSMPGREILFYQTGNRPAKIDGQVEGETVRLAPRQMGELFQTSRSNVAEYIRRIPVESGLTESSAWRNFRRVRRAGNRDIVRNYSIDMHTLAEVFSPMTSLFSCRQSNEVSA